MPFKMGPWEIALILVIILIVFGVGKLPQVGSSIGNGLRSFKKAQAGEEEEEEEKKKEPAAASPKDATDNKTEKS
jgi:sec-independent protein translocase protein TatA